MDVEKTIEFLLSSQAAAEVRLNRLEALTASNAEDIKGLAGKLAELAQVGIDSGERFNEQDRKLAQRIDNLVSGIGEFMRRDVPPNTQ